MPEPAVTETVVEPVAPVVESTEPVRLEGGSVADHAAAFGPQAETTEETPAQVHHSAQQRRDKQTQQFAEGRRRAQSQRAGAEDVPRIKELTGKWRAAEEERDRFKAELESLRKPAQPVVTTGLSAPAGVLQPAASVAPAPSTTPAPAGEAEPDESDAAKYPDGQFDKAFLRDYSRWHARQEQRAFHAQHERDQAEKAETQRWQAAEASARTKAANFDAVAYAGHPAAAFRAAMVQRASGGSLVDAFILDAPNGPDVLYHLQSHPQELDALTRMPQFQQITELALLQQRLASPTPAQAGITGAVAGSAPRVLPPKPPTPVRTEAQRAGHEPPATDGTLSLADHAKAFGPSRQR